MIGRTLLGRYEIQRLLGEGGMGRVYLAKQTDLGRPVVVKVMHEHIAADPKFRDRFQRETLLMARFQHPYAVTLYDAALNADEGSCIVMEYVKGGNLEALLEKVKKMTAPRVVRLLIQLCEVLQAAHDEGVIHRDLKPANLMVVDPDTPKERIKVMDFGLAKLIDDNPAERVTDTSVDFAVGTPAYICPEQVRGEAMDHRGDLYSVGVMAFELLAGRVPFKGSSGMDVLLAHATEDPPTFASLGLGSWVPPGIETVLRKCLAKFPEDRQQSARQLGEELTNALGDAKLFTESGHKIRALAVEVEPKSKPKADSIVSLTEAVAGPTQRTVAKSIPIVPVPAATVINTPPPANASTPTPTFGETPTDFAFQMEAWMPESIAIMKLRGYVQDCGGEILKSEASKVRMRIGRATWFGRRASGPVEVVLKLLKPNPNRPTQLMIHVAFVPSHPSLLADHDWRKRCSKAFLELRSYLMGGIVV